MVKKSLVIFALAVFAFASGVQGADEAAPAPTVAEVGALAPMFKLYGHDGKEYQLADYKGKVVVLEWYNEGCPFVKKHYDSGNMQKLQKTYTDKGVVWFSIISSAVGKQGYLDVEQANKVKKDKNAANTAILLDIDGRVGKSYQAKVTPHMYIIDATGKLVYEGAIDDKATTEIEDVAKAKNYVVDALEETLGGKKVKVARTKAYGCGIKY